MMNAHRLLRSALLVLLLAHLGTLHASAQPAPHHPGQWTAARELGGTAVHLHLLRGDMSIHRGSQHNHAELLWWRGEDDDIGADFLGGLYGWRFMSDRPESAYAANLFGLALPSPGDNIFCAGGSALGDGNLLVTGGHVTSPTGTNGAIVFNRATRTWQTKPGMASRRW